MIIVMMIYDNNYYSCVDDDIVFNTIWYSNDWRIAWLLEWYIDIVCDMIGYGFDNCIVWWYSI